MRKQGRGYGEVEAVGRYCDREIRNLGCRPGQESIGLLLSGLEAGIIWMDVLLHAPLSK